MPDLTGHILVVDDEPFNLELMQDLLEAKGHRVLLADRGEAALVMVRDHRPDLVLLDIMMPGQDGFQVCRTLKSDPSLAHIPVILLTALGDRKNRLSGMEAGANDFLVKPIDTADVLLRVRNALSAKQLFDQVQRQNQQLQELCRLRDNLASMLVHDLKSPLTAIIGYLKLVLAGSEREREFLGRAVDNSQRLLEMICSLLDVERLQGGDLVANPQRLDLGEVIQQCLGQLGSMLGRLQLIWSPPPEPIWCYADAELTRRILTNLLDNALKFVPGEGGEVEIRVFPGSPVQVSIRDNGRGIPLEYHERIFEKFGQVNTDLRYSTGLGLTFCKLAAEAQGGRIGLESQPGQGSTFWFSVPGC